MFIRVVAFRKRLWRGLIDCPSSCKVDKLLNGQDMIEPTIILFSINQRLLCHLKEEQPLPSSRSSLLLQHQIEHLVPQVRAWCDVKFSRGVMFVSVLLGSYSPSLLSNSVDVVGWTQLIRYVCHLYVCHFDVLFSGHVIFFLKDELNFYNFSKDLSYFNFHQRTHLIFKIFILILN